MFDMKKPDEREDQKVHQLLDIIAEEISDVDRAANKRTYLVVKRRTDMDVADQTLGPEVVTDEAGNLTAMHKAADDEAQGPDSGAAAKAAVTTKAQDDDEAGDKERTKQALVMPAAVKQALLQTTTDALKRLMAVVDAIKAAEESDEKTDKPTPDSAAREMRAVCQLLEGALKQYPAPVSKDDTDDVRSDVDKAGARLSGKRRDQLKNAIELLQKLLEEVLPSKAAPRGATPEDRSTKLADRANVGADVQPGQDATQSAQEILSDVPGLADVLKSLTSLSDVAGELKSKVQGQDEEIARLRKSTGLPASREVDAVKQPQPAKPVSWPLDMNRPLTREKVAKEVSFFD